jgi:hypothetical protein
MAKKIIVIIIVCIWRHFSCAQDSNFQFPIEKIEDVLLNQNFELRAVHGARFKEDAAKTGTLVSEDKTFFKVKVKGAVPGGEVFNNNPRFEVAAYELQKLFLDPGEYVVPPTACRSLPLEIYRQKVDPKGEATFRGTESVIFILQYWLMNVTQQDVFDENRLESDSLYARYMANLNIFTYLILHHDANKGNVLISSDSTRPRAFSVDNGVAFGAQESERGTEWKEIRVKRLPQKTVERLRRISLPDLTKQLGVVSQFQIQNKQLISVAPGENLKKSYGIRRSDDMIQLGLTDWEIEDVYKRLQELLKQIDQGKFELF